MKSLLWLDGKQTDPNINIITNFIKCFLFSFRSYRELAVIGFLLFKAVKESIVQYSSSWKHMHNYLS